METTWTLRDGNEIPAIGFGTYPLRGEDAISAVGEALRVGYKMVDTAFNYDNEAAVGQGVARSGVPREDLFIVSKMPGRYHERPLSDHAIRESLWRMGLDYFDMYLIHWPNPARDLYVEAWQAILDAQEAGLIKTVGVSNFTISQLKRLEEETGTLPQANQIECHPYFPQAEQVLLQENMGVRTISWSPLGKASQPAKEPVIMALAEKYEVTPAQVVLRWQIQCGCIPIPKSATPSRIAENFNVFDFSLTREELESITALGRSDGRLFDGDPDVHEEL